MSVPIAPAGPLNVLMKPILIKSYPEAVAGPASSASPAAATTAMLFMGLYPLVTAHAGATSR